MDVNSKDEQLVLLVQEKGSDRMNVVTGLDENGKPKTVAPKVANEPEFFKLDKHGNGLENFMVNYVRQAKDPTHFGFFKVPIGNIEANAQILSEMSQKGNIGKEFLNDYRVNTAQYKVAKEQVPAENKAEVEQSSTETKQEYKPIDESCIDWKQLEKLGVSRDTLLKNGSLDAMLNWRKTPVLIPISPKFDDITLYTQARLSFHETADGQLKVAIHAIQKQPELDRPFYGNTFSKEDKKNLLTNGNLGRTVELKMPNIENPVRAFVSVDKLNNELVAFRSDRIRIPDEIKGIKLNDEQKKILSEGKILYLEGMTAKSGNTFNATVQVNADKRGIEFQFDGASKQSQKQTQSQDPGNHQNQKIGDVKIPSKLGGVELSDKDQSTLKEGGVIYVKGLVDKKGQQYNAYVQVNSEKEKLDFFKWNPQKKQDAIPDNNAKTQVAVNSEGKTNEATKQSSEPIKSGQVQTTRKLKQETEQKQELQKKSKGVKI